MRGPSHALRIALGTVVVLAVLAVLHLKPWKSGESGTLSVGYLPVTCHLTCPVTDYATRTTHTSTRFISQRFSDFPTVVEALKTRDVDATFLLAPLAMLLVEQGVPVKIVYLGHRDGSTLMVRKDSTAQSIRDLRGKTLAIPSHYSNQYLVLTKLMEDSGMAPGDINFVEMPPPDMPASLTTGSIDAYFVGEPFAAKAEMDGSGRVLYLAKDIWPNFVSCVLVVRQELIDDHPEVVRDLVRGIAESGEWAETHRHEVAHIVQPYYAPQNEALLDFVLSQPGRVSYRNLTPTDDDLEGIMKYAIKAGLLKGTIDLSKLVDRQFIPSHIEPAQISME
jgi:NitT/TauT family transport system substrate-binding protein